MKSKKAIVIILILLAAAVFISGCVGQSQSTIKSEAEAGQAITNVSTDVDKLVETFNDIDSKIG